MSDTPEVIIVGAGMAGLSAAERLIEEKAVSPSAILFVEALDRVGGRTLGKTQPIDREPNNPVDVGACWICPEQPAVWDVTTKLGLKIVDQASDGMRVHVHTTGGVKGALGRLFGWNKEEESDAQTSLFGLPAADVLAYIKMGKALDKLAQQVIEDSDKPWEAKDAKTWDSMTVEDWLVKEVANIGARGILRSAVLAVFCLPTTQYSMLMFLAALKHESFDMFTTGAQSHRCLQGFGSLAPMTWDKLKKQGVKLQLNTKLVSCEQNDDGVVTLGVKSSSSSDDDDGEKEAILKAKRVIITIPAPQYKEIKFKPELPQAPYAHDMLMGKCIKTVLAYKEKWWSATAAFADPAIEGRGPISLVFDVSNPGEPMLATFYYGDAAIKYSGNDKKDERKELSMKGAQALLSADPAKPDPRALEPLSVVEGDWPSQDHIWGGYAGVPPTGAITKHKTYHRQLAARSGLVHFAGTETSSKWAGYIEGAIVTGRQAAMEVMEQMGKTPTMKAIPPAPVLKNKESGCTVQ